MGRTLRFLAAQVMFAALSVSAFAQEPAPKPGSPATEAPGTKNVFQNLRIELLDLDKLREEVNAKLVGAPMKLTVDEAVQIALKNNQDILIADYGTGIADAELMAARGQFDPAVALSAQHSDSALPASAQVKNFTGGRVSSVVTRQQDYKLQIRGVTPVGTQYSFGFDVNRERGTFVRDSVTGEPLTNYTADWTLAFTQPLLRGLGTKANLIRVRRAKNDQQISDAQVQLALINAIGRVVKNYWDLVGAVEQLKVRQEALDNAVRVQNINEQRFKLGTASELEVFEAKAGVATRQSDLITARTVVLDAEDVLKAQMGLMDGELLSGANIIPTDRPVIHDPDYDLAKSMQTAIDRRPDVKAAELAIANADLDVKANRNAMFPQIDLTTSYGRNTLQLEGSDIFSGLNNVNNRTWTVGIVASVPIGNRAARGIYQQSKLFKMQDEQRLIKVKQDAMLAVRAAVHALLSNRILVESTKQARVLEQANVNAEIQRLTLGVTTAQNVLLKQEDLTAAQANEVRAQVNFERSQIDLQVAEGTLLDKMNIAYDVPQYESAPRFFESVTKLDSHE